MNLLFPSLISPVSRKMDPLDSSVCTLLSLTPPPHSPNDHHASSHSSAKDSDQCWALSLAWSRRRDSSLHPRTMQLITGFAAKGTLQMLNTAVWFYHTEAALSQNHLSDGNIKASLQWLIIQASVSFMVTLLNVLTLLTMAAELKKRFKQET